LFIEKNQNSDISHSRRSTKSVLNYPGKRAFSVEIAAKIIPPEVVKLRSKNSQGAAGQMVRTGVM
jgi:Sec7-like guanine-nucleotide exchange factor